MQQNWNHFFTSLDLDQNQHHPASGAEENRIYLLNGYRLVSTEGQDAGKFLQGQASCDSRLISHIQAQYGSFNTPKGRAYAHFLSSQYNDEYLLRFNSSVTDSSLKSLNKYLAFFKAQQNDRTADFSLFGLKGSNACRNIKLSFGDCPQQKLSSISNDKGIIIAIDPDNQLYECWIKNSALADCWPKLSQDMCLSEHSHWQLELIRLGIAEITAATAEQYIAQMLNYQLTGAISFTKGCFTGQEIIARMQYKAKLKRRLYRIELSSSATIMAGDEIYDAQSTQSLGNIINIAASSQDTQEALAVLINEACEQRNFSVRIADQPQTVTLSLLDLPYNSEAQ